MNFELVRLAVQAGRFKLSLHAEFEAEADGLAITQIVAAIVTGTVLEAYPDTGRGESCLVVGLANETPVHVVCGLRGDYAVIVTVYIPRPPKFVDPWTRGAK